ncbi:hypothetical protein [Cystobacter fuscus]|uniref:hypothetical protein n=1 Tax=Cystobacter fuscus TaxID=43 RepID=UPI002B2864BD|nr:hypothetical protein F0U63_46400 [Cystobacter fuscus]
MSDQNKPSGSITSSMSDREQVERTADRLRDELLLTLEELDRRRERALDVKYQLRQLLARNRETLLAAGGVAVAMVVVGAGFSWWNERRQARIVWERRGRALRRAWEHPDQVASASRKQPLALELGRKLVFIFGSALASALAKNAVATLVPSSEAQPGKQGNKRLGLHLMQQEARA